MGSEMCIRDRWLLDLILRPDAVQLRLENGSAISRLHFELGEVIFRQGDIGDLLYILVKGEVEIIDESVAEPTAITTLGPGEYFGEIAVMKHQTRSATVRSVTPVDLIAIRQNDFNSLMTNLPELRDSFENVMEVRQNRSNQLFNDKPESSRSK